MKVNLVALKSWCTETITPLAWQRVVIKVLPELRDSGYGLTQLENPSDEMFFKGDEVGTVQTAISDLYGLQIPDEILAKG